MDHPYPRFGVKIPVLDFWMIINILDLDRHPYPRFEVKNHSLNLDDDPYSIFSDDDPYP